MEVVLAQCLDTSMMLHWWKDLPRILTPCDQYFFASLSLSSLETVGLDSAESAFEFKERREFAGPFLQASVLMDRTHQVRFLQMIMNSDRKKANRASRYSIALANSSQTVMRAVAFSTSLANAVVSKFELV